MSVELTLWRPTAREIADTADGELTAIRGADENTEIVNVATASGECSRGSLFCAIKGERADGADFIPQAAELGAVCVLTTRAPSEIPDPGAPIVVVTVDNVVRALGKLAFRYRCHSRAKFVAVTGSVGKTTTKEMIASVASTRFRTHKTKGNHNNELGLPLTLFELIPRGRGLRH
ncbi:MAG: hypothetical protein IKG80_04220 [Clostridia bacterium]|nr:hypothetical protein [Clostridia bacterium]